MYEAFYGLRERPFNLTPDPKYLYLSDKHKEAFAHLLYGIKNRSGFVMISGEIGTGKTTICRNMLSQMDANTEVAFIFNPFLNPVELLKKINQEFGIVSSADNVLELTEELNRHLLNAAAGGKNSVLVIDEAQNLEPQVLEQIRLLSNLETDTEKLLQIILIGQPELAEKLALHELRQLNQRITARYHLKPLNALETLQYIAYRIHVAGGRKRLNFTKGAIKSIYRKSGGVPRMINALCDRALLIGYTKEQHVITASIIRQAAREIRGEKLAAKGKNRINWRRWTPSPSLVVLVILLLALAHYLVDPLDRFARELNVFNRILAGDAGGGANPTEERQNPGVTADSAEQANASSPAPTTQELSALQLVMERLNTSTSPRPAESLAAVFTELDARETLHAGVDALISLWNLRLAGEYPENDDPESLIRYFQRQNLACEHLRPNVEQLLRINLPGLVQLVAGGNKIWMTILRADDDSVTLQADDNRRITVSQSEFGIYYGREFLAPWNDPAPDAPVLLPGQRGARVRSFKELLHELGRLDAADINDVYDRKTEEVVMAIQAEAGLTADGKAGPQVRLALTSWLGSAPSLKRGASRAARGVPKSHFTDGALAATPFMANPVTTAGERDAHKVNENAAVDFQVVVESTADVDMMPAELPVMALPSAPEPEPESPPTGVGEERRLFRLLREQQIDKSVGHDDSENEGDAEPVLMEVRELPEPAVPTQQFLSETNRYDSVTPPVFGSAPLTPSEEARP